MQKIPTFYKTLYLVSVPAPPPSITLPELEAFPTRDFIKDSETAEMQVNIDSDVNKKDQDVTAQDETTEEEEEEFEQPQSQPSLPNSENPSVVNDCNPDETWQTRFRCQKSMHR